MSKKDQKELISNQVNEIAANITPEYWPHDLFADEDRYKYVRPFYFYDNFKCLIATTDPYLTDDEYNLFENIEAHYFRFFLWLNNNPLIEEDYKPQSSLRKNRIDDVIEKLSESLYLKLAPMCYNLINHQRFIGASLKNKEAEKDLKEKILNTFSEILEEVRNAINSLPRESETDIENFANKGFQIISEQGLT